ncbi:MAG: hypothetical protein ABSB88_11705 [Bryobacteraceae bacterium]|jgi:hypothetical protein
MFRSLKLLGGSALALALLLVMASVPATAAQAERQIDCGVAVTNDGVVITRVTVGNVVVPCMAAPGPPDGRGPYQSAPPFQADDDWLQNVTIYLFNRTNKTIVWAGVQIGFPQTGDGRSPATPQHTYNITVGRRPAVANFSPRTGQPMPLHDIPLSFAGGRTQAIRLSEYIDQIRYTIQDALFAPVTSIRINPAYFIFDDGMSWSPGGHFATPDQEHPGKWKPMPHDYFPGNVHANWPPDRIGIDRK